MDVQFYIFKVQLGEILGYRRYTKRYLVTLFILTVGSTVYKILENILILTKCKLVCKAIHDWLIYFNGLGFAYVLSLPLTSATHIHITF